MKESLKTKNEQGNIANISDLNIGDLLKNHRIAANIEMADIAKSLNVKKNDLINLENNEIFTKRSASYINGLIRSYGKLVAVDDDVIKKELRNLAKNISPISQEYNIIDPNKEKKQNSPNRKILLLSVLAVAILYFIIALYNINLGYDFTSDDITGRM